MSDFQEKNFFLEHYCQPTISIYYKELNLTEVKVIDLASFIGTGPYYQQSSL